MMKKVVFLEPGKHLEPAISLIEFDNRNVTPTMSPGCASEKQLAKNYYIARCFKRKLFLFLLFNWTVQRGEVY
jgi:hypothetical protein